MQRETFIRCTSRYYFNVRISIQTPLCCLIALNQKNSAKFEVSTLLFFRWLADLKTSNLPTRETSLKTIIFEVSINICSTYWQVYVFCILIMVHQKIFRKTVVQRDGEVKRVFILSLTEVVILWAALQVLSTLWISKTASIITLLLGHSGNVSREDQLLGGFTRTLTCGYRHQSCSPLWGTAIPAVFRESSPYWLPSEFIHR